MAVQCRLATCLARLWNSQGKLAEARDLLFPLYEWFTKGFDIVDLVEARAFLKKMK